MNVTWNHIGISSEIRSWVQKFMEKYFSSLKLFSDLHQRNSIHVTVFITTGRRCHLLAVQNIYGRKEEALHLEHKEI
jgi:hypothetical protein